jgi:hypothetical protein
MFFLQKSVNLAALTLSGHLRSVQLFEHLERTLLKGWLTLIEDPRVSFIILFVRTGN